VSEPSLRRSAGDQPAPVLPLYRDGLAEAIRLRPVFSLVGQAGEVLHAIERDGLNTRVLLVSAFSEGERVHDAPTRVESPRRSRKPSPTSSPDPELGAGTPAPN
jgi:hypothetical protein